MKMMKKISLAVTCLLVSGFGVIGSADMALAEVIGVWTFDGDAADSSGNGNHGTVVGATLVTDRFGNADSAFEFDGNDHIITTSVGFPTGASPISYSLWIKPGANPGSDRRVIEYGGYFAGRSFNLYIHANRYRIDYWGFQNYDLDETMQNEWQHVVLTSDGTQHKFYLNGTLTFNDPKQLNLLNGNKMNFGRFGNGGFNFVGTLDDIRLYDHALSAAEVEELFGASAVPALAPVGQLGLAAGLLAAAWARMRRKRA